MSTLSFQPEAERYYAEGHWRSGDLWADFAARAAGAARQGGADARRPAASPTTSCGARPSRCPRASPPARWQPGDVVILLGRHSIEAAVALLGCLHRGVVLAPLPPMFNVTQLSALSSQTRAKGDRRASAARRRSPSASSSRTTSTT